MEMNQQSNVTIKNSLNTDDPHEYRLLSNALGELEEFEEDDINPEDGDTDTEAWIDADTAETKLALIMEVTGHIEIQTSGRATKGTKKKRMKEGKKGQNSPISCKY